jgi:hypothetical protein
VETAVYRLGGLRIVSDFPLVGLQLCPNDVAREDVVIRRARIPEKLSAATATFRDGQCVGEYNGQEVLCDFSPIGRFLVRAGKEILTDAAHSSDAGEVCTYLLSTAFGLLCYQRGITPLHASAIDVADGCVAFVGASGAGKSTLAAALARCGHRVISDDVCFLRSDTYEGVQVWPGMSRIRLWEDARAALGYDGPGVEREMRGYNKYFVPVRPPPNPTKSRRLRRIYQLDRAPGGVTSVTRLGGSAAIEVLMQNLSRLSLAERLGYKPRAFMLCVAAARDVPIFRFSRTLGFDALNENIKVLEHHMTYVA